MQFGGQHGGVPTIGMAFPGYYQSEDGVGNPEMTWYANSVPFSVNFGDDSFQKFSVESISKNSILCVLLAELLCFFVNLYAVPFNHLCASVCML